MTRDARWICCHLGAREHYAVPRSLHRRGELAALITDAWAGPGLWSLLPGGAGRRLGERYSADLESASVRAFTPSLVAKEMSWRIEGLVEWPLMIARNNWFQARAARAVRALGAAGTSRTVFAHSYAALEIFKQAKANGWITVLGQIDPGEGHMRTVADVAERWPEFGPKPLAPPPQYFANWREECRLADRIVVNSEWSRDRLVDQGIDASRIDVLALPYEADAHDSFERRYPSAFTAARPLRALFVGSVATFKGVPLMLEAIERLRDLPIELRIVGPLAASIPDRYLRDPRYKWIGAVSRSEVMNYYRDSDVLLFPSHSDGFGMVQVEALAWRLPVIASRSCGRVVVDEINGLLLPEVSGDAIAAALRQVMDPSLLSRLSAAPLAGTTGLDAFGARLSEIGA